MAGRSMGGLGGLGGEGGMNLVAVMHIGSDF